MIVRVWAVKRWPYRPAQLVRIAFCAVTRHAWRPWRVDVGEWGVLELAEPRRFAYRSCRRCGLVERVL